MSALEQPFIDAIAAKEIEGVILAGKTKDGTSYSNAIGTHTLLDGSEKPLSTSDILFAASCTKLLVTIAVLQCCEREQLSLDEDVRSQLPTLVEKGVLATGDAASDDSLATEAVKNAITFRRLLTHSSGAAYHMFNPTLKRWREANPIPKDASDVPDCFSQPLAFQPGEGWLYGTGLDWAGYLVEKATGLKLDEYIRTHILGPLGGSSDALSFFPVKEGMGDRMPDLNPKDPRGEGLSASMGIRMFENAPTACLGGGGAYVTADAYVAVLYSILANDEKILTKASVEEMFKPQLEAGARRSLRALLDNPATSVFGFGTTGQGQDFGLGGLLVGEDGDGHMGKGSMTWGGGINSIWFIDPKNGVCGFACPQLGLPPSLEKAIELKEIFRRELPGHLMSIKH